MMSRAKARGHEPAARQLQREVRPSRAALTTVKTVNRKRSGVLIMTGQLTTKKARRPMYIVSRRRRILRSPTAI
jgi:hypothetical protein